jgi:hypothetical protein
MKLIQTNHTERLALITTALDALESAKTNEVELHFSNDIAHYGISVLVAEDGDCEVVIFNPKTNDALNAFVPSPARKFNRREMSTLFSLVSLATSDFECGFAFANYLARTI